MHEIGLLKNALSQVKQEALRNGLTKVRRIDLVIGKMQGITPASLEHAMDIARAEDPLFAGCRVQIKEVEGTMECLGCGHRFALDQPADSCPSCGGANVRVATGLEFYVESYEGD